MEKCKLMHFGKFNPKAIYCMTDISGNERNIVKMRLEKDLDMNVKDDLKWSGHVDRAVAKANRILGMLKRTFESMHPGLWKDLYVSLVMAHLEYAVQAWNSHLHGDIEKIERVQKRATRIPIGSDKLEFR